MTEKRIIQLVDEVPGEEGEVVRHFRWGLVDELSDWYTDSQVGIGSELLENLGEGEHHATLLLPGQKIVAMPVAFDKKQARHFLNLLPYQIEDDVIGNVDELHFAVGPKNSEVISVAYIEEDWFADLIAWFKENHIVVDSALADFQSLQANGDELILWFTDGYVWGHRANGLGFAVAQSMSQLFLKDLLQNQQSLDEPWTVRVYVDDAETKEIIDGHIMPPVAYEVIIGRPTLGFEQENHLNFASGKYGKKLPIARWWQEAKPVAILAAAALVVFFTATFADIYLMKQDRENNQQAILSEFRAVVPKGPTTDPVRRLKAKLGGSGSSTAEASQTIYLISKVAPVLKQLKIDLSTLNYSNREQALRINIMAASFNGIEEFRQQLDKQGVNAELQSSNAADDGFQARLKIAMK